MNLRILAVLLCPIAQPQLSRPRRQPRRPPSTRRRQPPSRSPVPSPPTPSMLPAAGAQSSSAAQGVQGKLAPLLRPGRRRQGRPRRHRLRRRHAPDSPAPQPARRGLLLLLHAQHHHHGQPQHQRNHQVPERRRHGRLFPLPRPLRLSGGATIYNDTGLTATLSVPTGQSFTVGGTTYYSEPYNAVTNPVGPIQGTGVFTFGGNKVVPRATIGSGNMLPKKGHFRFESEIGFQYFSAPTVVYNFHGGGCTAPNSYSTATPSTRPTSRRTDQAAERPLRPALLPHPLLRPQLQDPLTPFRGSRVTPQRSRDKEMRTCIVLAGCRIR